MLAVVGSGGQAALLAPTEVLAQQHYKNFQMLLGELGLGGTLSGASDSIGVAILTGSLSSAERSITLSGIASGSIGIVVGTHALLSQGVDFKDLGLVVIDEQHRFGVEQRDALRSKAELPPHVLVMTATPIPRTVAMTVFGDLDVSVLDELPLGRAPITTHVVATSTKPQFLQRAWERVREEVSAGHQVYIVAPRISKSDSTDFSRFGMSEEELKIARRLSGAVEKEPTGDMTAVEELFPRLESGELKGLRLPLLKLELTCLMLP